MVNKTKEEQKADYDDGVNQTHRNKNRDHNKSSKDHNNNNQGRDRPNLERRPSSVDHYEDELYQNKFVQTGRDLFMRAWTFFWDTLAWVFSSFVQFIWLPLLYPLMKSLTSERFTHQVGDFFHYYAVQLFGGQGSLIATTLSKLIYTSGRVAMRCLAWAFTLIYTLSQQRLASKAGRGGENNNENNNAASAPPASDMGELYNTFKDDMGQVREAVTDTVGNVYRGVKDRVQPYVAKVLPIS